MNLSNKKSATEISATDQNIEDKTALTSFLFSRMNIFNIKLIQMQQSLAQRDAQIKDLQRQLSEAYNVFKR